MILVTGGTGLVGSHLLLALLENHPTVRAIYRHEMSIKKTKSLFQCYKKEYLFDNIQWIQADITDVTTLEIAFENITQVYHCAALISFDPNDEEVLRKINIEGTANMVNFCIDNNVNKFCYVSSVAALGDLKEHETIVTEETEWNPELPHSDYAISKYGAEMEVWRGQQEGLNVVIVNPGVIIGPGFWDNGSGVLFSKIKKGMPFYTDGATGFIGVSDVVDGMIYLMNSSINGERFCLISDHCSFEFILKTIAASLNVKEPQWHANATLTSIVWRTDWLMATLLGRKRTWSKLLAKSLHQKTFYSNQKIKAIYSNPFQDIKQCIENTATLYLNQ